MFNIIFFLLVIIIKEAFAIFDFSLLTFLAAVHRQWRSPLHRLNQRTAWKRNCSNLLLLGREPDLLLICGFTFQRDGQLEEDR